MKTFIINKGVGVNAEVKATNIEELIAELRSFTAEGYELHYEAVNGTAWNCWIPGVFYSFTITEI